MLQYVGIATRHCADYSLITSIYFTENDPTFQPHIFGQNRVSVQKSNTFFSVCKIATIGGIVR